MSYSQAIDAEVNADLVPALDALTWWLLDHHYSAGATFDIAWHAALEGTLAGAPLLEPEDEAGAEEAYVNALPAVGYDDPAWGEPEDLEDLDAALSLPAICGGAPEPDEADSRWWAEQVDNARYEPSESDWQEFHAWAAEIDYRAALAREAAAPSGSWD